MKIIVFPKGGKKTTSINLGARTLYALAFVLIMIPMTVAYMGFELGKKTTLEMSMPANWSEEIEIFRQEVDFAAKSARQDMNGLVMRLGQLQAQVIRLNAVGRRVVKLAGLEKGEFDFDSVPAQGGPHTSESALLESEYQMPDMIAILNQLSAELQDRGQQLKIVESFHMSRNLRRDVVPQGRPVRSGWMSSYYGMRTDPFTGSQEMHKGMDFAGKEGTQIIAVADGVVTWSGDRYGYGRMVEISHGGDYVTRYAHNKESLVQIGDTIKKGQTIALMGSSGRSTGPHVHFEVHYKGRETDPAKYVYAIR